MSEPTPLYIEWPERNDPDANAAAIIEATRRETTYRALDDAGAAEAGLLRLVAEIARLRDLLSLGQLDDDALYAVRRQLGDYRQCAEALGVRL